jgi:hypothetical protein
MKNYLKSLFFIACFWGIFIEKTSLSMDKNIPKKLNILVVVGIFPKASEVFVLNQIVGLLEQGHTVTICANQKGDEKELQSDVIHHHLLDHAVYQRPTNLDSYDVILIEFGTFAKPYTDLKKEVS